MWITTMTGALLNMDIMSYINIAEEHLGWEVRAFEPSFSEYSESGCRLSRFKTKEEAEQELERLKTLLNYKL